MINGYIYEAEGKFLSKLLFWFLHDSREDAWVHEIPPPDMVNISRRWETRPIFVHIATYNPDTKETIILETKRMVDYL